MIKDLHKWPDHWKVDINPELEDTISKDLVKIFEVFWIFQKLDDKSKTTQNRYSGALHVLGGYLIEKTTYDENELFSASDLLDEYLSPYEGPLIHQDNESWQKEIDTACKQLYKYLKSKP